MRLRTAGVAMAAAVLVPTVVWAADGPPRAANPHAAARPARSAPGSIARTVTEWFRRVDPHATSITLGAADMRGGDLVAVPVDAVLPSITR